MEFHSIELQLIQFLAAIINNKNTKNFFYSEKIKVLLFIPLWNDFINWMHCTKNWESRLVSQGTNENYLHIAVFVIF